MSWYYHYAYWLQEESTHFGLRVSTQFGIENYKKRIGNIPKIFRIIPTFFIFVFFHGIFYIELWQNFHPKYYVHTNQTTYYLTHPVLCHYPPRNLFISDLAYSTRTNSFLWSNLNYKKLLKWVNTTTNYKKTKNVLITQVRI